MLAFITTVAAPLIKVVAPHAKKIVVGLVAALVVAVAALFYLYTDQVSEVQRYKDTASRYEQQVAELQASITDERSRHTVLQESRRTGNIEFNDVRREILAARGRQEQVKADPAGYEKQIQASFDAVVKDLMCLTGDTGQCSSK